jgi:hypothetical protein
MTGLAAKYAEKLGPDPLSTSPTGPFTRRDRFEDTSGRMRNVTIRFYNFFLQLRCLSFLVWPARHLAYSFFCGDPEELLA